MSDRHPVFPLETATLIIILFHLQQQLPTNAVYSKPPKCPQNSSLSHLRGLVDLSHQHAGGNVVTTKAEICATPPQNRRRFFIPKHLRSPFGIYKNRNNNNNGAVQADQNYTFSGKTVDNDIIIHVLISETLNRHQKAFFHKNFAGFASSMNSSSNSEMGLLSNSSPSQSLVKVKSSANKENKLQRFGGAVVNGGTLVFGKIKSLWSHNSTGLNTMLSDHRRKSQENLGLY